jgi:tRNA U34 5-methylaminomethyl-2-thiouridine-forming methyltransferase MnmC
MARELYVTADGSHSVNDAEKGISFHSRFGALQESKHIFIEAGLMPHLHRKQTTHILEMGFGTGLNAFLTLSESIQKNQSIWYDTIEAFPLPPEIWQRLNFAEVSGQQALQSLFLKLHEAAWSQPVSITGTFTIFKHHCSLKAFEASRQFDIVYFDAFAPEDQPELWTEESFRTIARMMAPGAALVTYCSKGAVRRALIAAGLQVEKLPGPAGKREIVRATKKTE